MEFADGRGMSMVVKTTKSVAFASLPLKERLLASCTQVMNALWYSENVRMPST
jgi:hypothetical protein